MAAAAGPFPPQTGRTRPADRRTRRRAPGGRRDRDGGRGALSLAPFTEVLAQDRELGLHLVHHAGEEEGPDSIREALGPGRAERLGHGIRVLDDPELTAEIAERAIALEVCPSSNVTLGLVPSWPEHPLPRLIEAGLAVTLSTDVPDVAATTLTGEFRRAREVFGFDDRLLARPAAAAVTASFAPEARKTKLHKEIRGWLSLGAAA